MHMLIFFNIKKLVWNSTVSDFIDMVIDVREKITYNSTSALYYLCDIETIGVCMEYSWGVPKEEE